MASVQVSGDRRSLITTFALVWLPLLAWWLACYPALSTADSVNVWDQVASGHWTSHHPAPYTALVWLFTLLGRSPAPLAFAQTVTMALAVAFLAEELSATFDAGRWPRRAAVAMAALPWLGPFTITMWKDVPSLAALLALTGLLLQSSRRAGSPTRAGLAAIGLLSLVASLLRWNGGLTVGLAAVLAVAFLRPPGRRPVVVVTAAAAVAGFAALLLIPSVTAVAPMTATDRHYSQLADLAVIAHRHPVDLTAADQRTLESVAPLTRWATAGGHCYWVNDVLYKFIGRLGLSQTVARRDGALMSVWSGVLRRHPVDVVKGRLCRASLAWQLLQPRHSSYASVKVVDDHALSPRATPLVGWLHRLAHAGITLSTTHRALSWLWRPVPWLLLLGGAVALRRRRVPRRHVLVVLAVPVATVISYAVTAASNDARYTLPAVFVLALAVTAVAAAGTGGSAAEGAEPA